MGAFDAVLFDFGGVVVASPFDAIGAAAEGTGMSGEALLTVMMGDYSTDTDHPWHRLEGGEIAFTEWFDWFLHRLDELGVKPDFAHLRGFYETLQVHEEVVERIRALRAHGLRTALVTNNVKEFGDWRTKVPLDELFDVVVDSCEVGMRKPNEAIYRRALDRLGGVAPERAVFLDDHPGNVDGARRAGLHAILVTDPAVALVELDSLLAAA